MFFDASCESSETFVVEYRKEFVPVTSFAVAERGILAQDYTAFAVLVERCIIVGTGSGKE